MKTESDNLGFQLHHATRLLRKRFEKKTQGTGLSSAQWRLLVITVKEEGVHQARLAELLEIEPISVSRLIDRMEEGGWVERRPDPADRRVRAIYPTDKSQGAFQQIKSVAGEVYDEAMDGLSKDERAVVSRGLETIIQNLSEDEASAIENTLKGTAA